MANSFDFNALKKRYFTVTLNDENKTKLFITTPTKKVLDNFVSMKNTLEASSVQGDAIDELYDIVAQIMSHNKTGFVVTRDLVEELLDFEDIAVFINAYTNFISEVTGSKN